MGYIIRARGKYPDLITFIFAASAVIVGVIGELGTMVTADTAMLK